MMRFYDQLRRQGQSVDRYEELLVESLDADNDRGAERLLRQTRFLAASFRAYEQRVASLPGVDEHGLRAHLIRQAAAAPAAARRRRRRRLDCRSRRPVRRRLRSAHARARPRGDRRRRDRRAARIGVRSAHPRLAARARQVDGTRSDCARRRFRRSSRPAARTACRSGFTAIAKKSWSPSPGAPATTPVDADRIGRGVRAAAAVSVPRARSVRRRGDSVPGGRRAAARRRAGCRGARSDHRVRLVAVHADLGAGAAAVAAAHDRRRAASRAGPRRPRPRAARDAIPRRHRTAARGSSRTQASVATQRFGRRWRSSCARRTRCSRSARLRPPRRSWRRSLPFSTGHASPDAGARSVRACAAIVDVLRSLASAHALARRRRRRRSTTSRRTSAAGSRSRRSIRTRATRGVHLLDAQAARFGDFDDRHDRRPDRRRVARAAAPQHLLLAGRARRSRLAVRTRSAERIDGGVPRSPPIAVPPRRRLDVHVRR